MKNSEPPSHNYCQTTIPATPCSQLIPFLSLEPNRLRTAPLPRDPLCSPAIHRLQSQLQDQQQLSFEAVQRCGELQKLSDTLQSSVSELTGQLDALESERAEEGSVISPVLAEEHRQTGIRLLELAALFNSEDIFASNSCIASLLDWLESAVKDLQWRVQEKERELEEERAERLSAQERLQELEQERLLGSTEKLETISEDAERVAELEAEVARLQQTEAEDCDRMQSGQLELQTARLAAEQERDEALRKVQQLQDMLDGREESREREEELRYEQAELMAKCQTQDAELAELRAELSSEQERAEQLSEEAVRLSKMLQEVESLKLENAGLLSNLSLIKQEQQTIQQLHDTVAAEKEWLNVTLKDMEEVKLQNESLLCTVSNLEKEKKAIEEQHSVALSEKDRLNLAIQESDRERERLQLELAEEREKLNATLEKSDGEKEAFRKQLTEENDRLNTLIQNSTEEQQKLQAQLVKEKSALSSCIQTFDEEKEKLCSQMKEETDRLNSLIQKSDEERELLRAQLAEKSGSSEELVRSLEKCQRLEIELDAWRRLSSIIESSVGSAPAVSAATETGDPSTSTATASTEDPITPVQTDLVTSQPETASASETTPAATIEAATTALSRLSETAELGRRLAAEQDIWANERTQLITALNQKHSESLQYHAEIQRLTAAGGGQAEQLQLTAGQLAQTRRSRDEALAQCSQLRSGQDQLLVTLQERNQTIHDLQQQVRRCGSHCIIVRYRAGRKRASSEWLSTPILLPPVAFR